MVDSAKNEGNSLVESARLLVPASRSACVPMFVAFVDRFPSLRATQSEQFDFIMTVACVFLAATRLTGLKLGEDRKNQLMDIVANDLNAWNSDGIRAFEDCKKLFESEFDRMATNGHPKEFIASDALGIWIVWNLFGRQPLTDEEVLLVRAVGETVKRMYLNWWNV